MQQPHHQQGTSLRTAHHRHQPCRRAQSITKATFIDTRNWMRQQLWRGARWGRLRHMTNNTISRGGTHRLLVTNTGMGTGMRVTGARCTRQICPRHRRGDDWWNDISRSRGWVRIEFCNISRLGQTRCIFSGTVLNKVDIESRGLLESFVFSDDRTISVSDITCSIT